MTKDGDPSGGDGCTNSFWSLILDTPGNTESGALIADVNNNVREHEQQIYLDALVEACACPSGMD